MITVFSTGVAAALGVRDPRIFEMTRQYIYGYMVGVPFFTLTRILAPYLEIEGQYKRVITSSLMMTFIDIAADAFVVFVLHGGMFEIGLATSLGYVISFFIESSFFFSKNSRSIFRVSTNVINAADCLDIIKLGGFLRVSSAIGGTLINNLLTSLHMLYIVAAYGVFTQITTYIRFAWYSPAITMITFSGIFIGEEDKTSLKEAQKISLINAFIYCCIMTALLFVFAEPLSKIFMKSSDPAALTMASECIRVACFSLPFHAVVYNFLHYLNAIKRTRFFNFYGFLTECADIVIITFLLINIIGYRGAWLSRVVSMFVLSLIAIYYVYMNKEADNFRDKMLLLPRNFGILPENEIYVTAQSQKEIEDLSRVAIVFAMEHGAERRRAMNFGLITEELASFLAEHGFNDGKPHNINIRLIAKNDDLIIRMRDNCKPLNLTEYYKLLNTPEGKEKEAGLSIIMKMTKKVIYTPTFGANNILIFM